MALLGGGLAFLVLILVLALFVMVIVTLVNQMNTISAVSPQNRAQEPGMVWLEFVPLIGIVWVFINPGKVSDSLANEFRFRGITPPEPRPAHGIGIALAICRVAGALVFIIPFIGPLIYVVGILIMQFSYISKMKKYRQMLANAPAGGMVPPAGGYQQPQVPQMNTPQGWRPQGDEHTAPATAQAPPQPQSYAPPVPPAPAAPTAPAHAVEEAEIIEETTAPPAAPAAPEANEVADTPAPEAPVVPEPPVATPPVAEAPAAPADDAPADDSAPEASEGSDEDTPKPGNPA